MYTTILDYSTGHLQITAHVIFILKYHHINSSFSHKLSVSCIWLLQQLLIWGWSYFSHFITESRDCPTPTNRTTNNKNVFICYRVRLRYQTMKIGSHFQPKVLGKIMRIFLFEFNLLYLNPDHYCLFGFDKLVVNEVRW